MFLFKFNLNIKLFKPRKKIGQNLLLKIIIIIKKKYNKNKKVVNKSTVEVNIVRILAYQKQGMKLCEIEKKTNIPKSTINDWLKSKKKNIVL